MENERIIIDASVALKWYHSEEGSAIQQQAHLITADHKLKRMNDQLKTGISVKTLKDI